MGVFRIFTTLANALVVDPKSALEASLDELVAGYPNLAYIGDRKSLDARVLEQVRQMNLRLADLTARELSTARRSDAALTEKIEGLRARKLDAEYFARELYVGDWSKSSGIFPDFVLGLENRRVFADGALLELKDSKAASLASFNSTIPTRYKSLAQVRKITGSGLVSNAAKLFDFPLSAKPGYDDDLRSCFYLVRTHSQTYSQVRISLVEGSFFETLPKDKLMQAIWRQLLEARGVKEIEREQIVEILGDLDQSEIALSREIAGASIRPRLRLMAEVHPDGNINRYPEIEPRTLNLVLKKEETMGLEWLATEFERDGVVIISKERDGQESLSLQFGSQVIQMRVATINHRRNGEHLVLEMKLDP